MSDYDAAFEAALKGPASSPYDDVMKAVMDKVKPAASAPESVPLAAPPSFLEGMKQTAKPQKRHGRRFDSRRRLWRCNPYAAV
jgi:hypothetical protein